MSRIAPLLQLREDELSALDHLPAGFPVLVRVAALQHTDRLARLGFVRMPASVECFVRTPIDFASYGRNVRRSLQRAQALWSERRLRLELLPLHSVPTGWFFDQVYVPILARAFYRHGISPHGLQKRACAEAMFGRDVTLALVRDAVGELVGAALLERNDSSRSTFDPRTPSGGILEGLAHAFVERHQDLRRGLYVELAAQVAQQGERTLSLGRDLPWFEAPYVNVLEQKLRLAAPVAFEQTSDALYARWGSSEAHAFVELTPSGPRWRCGSVSLQERLTALTSRATRRCS